MHHYHPTEAEDEHFEVYEQTLERMGELGYSAEMEMLQVAGSKLGMGDCHWWAAIFDLQPVTCNLRPATIFVEEAAYDRQTVAR